MSFGHAGTIVEKKLDSPADKIRRMREAGISVAEEIGDIPRLVQGAPERRRQRRERNHGHVHPR